MRIKWKSIGIKELAAIISMNWVIRDRLTEGISLLYWAYE